MLLLGASGCLVVICGRPSGAGPSGGVGRSEFQLLGRPSAFILSKKLPNGSNPLGSPGNDFDDLLHTCATGALLGLATGADTESTLFEADEVVFLWGTYACGVEVLMTATSRGPFPPC